MHVREAAYGVLIKDQKILLSHTRSGARVIINFPGGAIDPGETAEAAVIREIKEESGGIVRIVRHIHSTDGNFINPDFPNNRLRCHYYQIEVVSDLNLGGNSKDVVGYEWFSLSNLPCERMLDVDVEFCRKL